MKLLTLVAVAFLAAACNGSRQGSETKAGPPELGTPPPSAAAAVVGTALDARTGKPLAGVRVVAPGGKSASTGSDGRFELAGLSAGTSGALEASLKDGRTGRVVLRPLVAGQRLEVVLHLAPPPAD